MLVVPIRTGLNYRRNRERFRFDILGKDTSIAILSTITVMNQATNSNDLTTTIISKAQFMMMRVVLFALFVLCVLSPPIQAQPPESQFGGEWPALQQLFGV